MRTNAHLAGGWRVSTPAHRPGAGASRNAQVAQVESPIFHRRFPHFSGTCGGASLRAEMPSNTGVRIPMVTVDNRQGPRNSRAADGVAVLGGASAAPALLQSASAPSNVEW